MTAPASKRPLWTIVAALLLGAAALWGSSRLVWSATLRDAGVRGMVLDKQTGAEHSGALVPLAVLALAGVAGMIATGGWPRRVLGVVLALAGLAACWVAVDGFSFGGYPAGAPVGAIYTGRGLALLGGILVILGGLLATRKAGSMPRLGAKYSAPGERKKARDPDTELWEALSEGEDPTK
ncbi:Trp biosynthesis-associated membrane protein [Amycolatopsis acidicola]|uniref:Trp biosynthesis-associated membrane protein n=1 Tax=Amycolatopsis acidicola TaxID=2596893 RepID=A0A5N0UR67_9PSEU|nr:Trp biosynthesis-associated membrane protein [Amycolatopsis acidicola]KAA9152918.1 Trp biosynthesis-associated membrane protein [Amycolatopsis acidicola]